MKKDGVFIGSKVNYKDKLFTVVSVSMEPKEWNDDKIILGIVPYEANPSSQEITRVRLSDIAPKDIEDLPKCSPTSTNQ